MAGFGAQLNPGSAEALLGQGGGGYSAGTALKPGTTDLSYLGPDILDYIENMAHIGYDTAVAMEDLEYQARRDDADRAGRAQIAEMNAQAAEERARIAAQGYTQAAAMGAEADMYAADQSLRSAQEAAAAARYSADRALEGLKISEENRMKIAAATLNLEAKRIAAEEMGAPSDWRTQAGYLRSQGMTQADITPSAIQQAGQALGPVDPAMYQAAPQAQQAVVGEAGPELATATPQGVEVQPIQRESAWWLRKQGVPGMQWGGTVTAGTALKPLTSSSQWGGRVGGVGGRFQPSPNFRYWGGARAPSTFQQGQGPQVNYMPGRGWLAGGTPVRGIDVSQGTPTGAGVWPGYGRRGTAADGATGAAGGGAGGGADTTPIAGDGTTTGEPPYLEMLRTGANVPLWEAWGGPRTKPEVGMDIPILMPHEINYGNFLRLTPTEQQMAFADWEALGMAPDTAFAIMQRSAMRGTGRAVTAYG